MGEFYIYSVFHWVMDAYFEALLNSYLSMWLFPYLFHYLTIAYIILWKFQMLMAAE